MTYKQLRDKLSDLTEMQLDDDVTIQTPDGEFYPARMVIQKDDDILDDAHVYLASN